MPKNLLKTIGIIAGALIILFIAVSFSKTFFRTSKQSANDYRMGIGGVAELDLSEGMMGNFSAPEEMASKSFSAGMMADSAMAPRSGTGPVTTTAVDKKIIKTGNMSLKVEKTETAAQAITNIARLYQGDVFNSNFYDSGRNTKTGYLTVRVPYANFEKTFNEIKAVATQVISESTNAQDITEEFVDLEARLKNKRAEEESFVNLLARSGKIEEILSVTREVARVRGEIEQLEGRLRYLNSQTDMSTISVNLTEDVVITPVNEGWRPWQVVKAAVKDLLRNGQGFIDGLIRFVVVVLPALLIYAFIIWLIYFIVKRIYRHYHKDEPKQ